MTFKLAKRLTLGSVKRQEVTLPQPRLATSTRTFRVIRNLDNDPTVVRALREYPTIEHAIWRITNAILEMLYP